LAQGLPAPARHAIELPAGEEEDTDVSEIIGGDIEDEEET
jgi:hypothetical protein